MDSLVSGHRRDLIKPLEGTQKALWALQGPSKGFMKPFKRPLGTPFLGGKRRVTLGKSALSDRRVLNRLKPALGHPGPVWSHLGPVVGHVRPVLGHVWACLEPS